MVTTYLSIFSLLQLILPIVLAIFIVIFVVNAVKRFEKRAEMKLELDQKHASSTQKQLNEVAEKVNNIEKLLKNIN